MDWAAKLDDLLMQQAVTKETVSFIAIAIAGWFGEKASTMDECDYAVLVAQAVKELRDYAWEMRDE
jgi:hypothetical protein